MSIPIALIVAVAENGVIGRENGLAWHVKSDLAQFRALTLGCPIIMGRKTFQSLSKPLPQRENIVLTRNSAFQPDGAVCFFTLEACFAHAQDWAEKHTSPRIAVIGGAELYQLALPFCDEWYLTRIHAQVEGDTFLPELPWQDYEEISREEHKASDGDEYGYTFVTLRRKLVAAKIKSRP
jgi:dihydrofolate reductase